MDYFCFVVLLLIVFLLLLGEYGFVSLGLGFDRCLDHSLLIHQFLILLNQHLVLLLIIIVSFQAYAVGLSYLLEFVHLHLQFI